MKPIISFSRKGEFKRTQAYLAHISGAVERLDLDRYGKLGVEALRKATPKDTGLTSESCTYEIRRSKDHAIVACKNSNENKGTNIALILQYGHGTRNGGYVKGIDYINPAIRPIFQGFVESAKREVIR